MSQFVVNPDEGRNTFGPQDGETQVESTVPAPTRQELGGSATFGSGVEPNPWAITDEQAAELMSKGDDSTEPMDTMYGGYTGAAPSNDSRLVHLGGGRYVRRS